MLIPMNETRNRMTRSHASLTRTVAPGNSAPDEVQQREEQLCTVVNVLEQELINLGKISRCSICLVSYNGVSEKASIILRCNHVFCKKCLDKCSGRCPSCNGSYQRRGIMPVPQMDQFGQAYKESLRSFGMAPVVFDASLDMTQLPDDYHAADDSSDDNADEKSSASSSIESFSEDQDAGITALTVTGDKIHSKRNAAFHVARVNDQVQTSRVMEKYGMGTDGRNREQSRIREVNDRFLAQLKAQQQRSSGAVDGGVEGPGDHPLVMKSFPPPDFSQLAASAREQESADFLLSLDPNDDGDSDGDSDSLLNFDIKNPSKKKRKSVVSFKDDMEEEISNDTEEERTQTPSSISRPSVDPTVSTIRLLGEPVDSKSAPEDTSETMTDDIEEKVEEKAFHSAQDLPSPTVTTGPLPHTRTSFPGTIRKPTSLPSSPQELYNGDPSNRLPLQNRKSPPLSFSGQKRKASIQSTSVETAPSRSKGDSSLQDQANQALKLPGPTSACIGTKEKDANLSNIDDSIAFSGVAPLCGVKAATALLELNVAMTSRAKKGESRHMSVQEQTQKQPSNARCSLTTGIVLDEENDSAVLNAALHPAIRASHSGFATKEHGANWRGEETIPMTSNTSFLHAEYVNVVKERQQLFMGKAQSSSSSTASLPATRMLVNSTDLESMESNSTTPMISNTNTNMARCVNSSNLERKERNPQALSDRNNSSAVIQTVQGHTPHQTSTDTSEQVPNVTNEPVSTRNYETPTTASANVKNSETFLVGTLVDVQKRTWPGVNKLGGRAVIESISTRDGTTTYNVKYALGGREKDVDGPYLSLVPAEEGLGSERTNSSARRSARIKRGGGNNIPAGMLSRLEADGYDVGKKLSQKRSASRNDKTRLSVHKPGGRKVLAESDDAVVLKDVVSPKLSKKTPILSNPTTTKSSQKSAKTSGKKSSKALASKMDPSFIRDLTREELCATADCRYNDIIEAGMKKGVIYVLCSSMDSAPEAEMALSTLCKTVKKSNVRLQIVEKLQSGRATVCVTPSTLTQSKAGVSAVNRVSIKRTVKLMKCALAGAPIIDAAWISQCVAAGTVTPPSTSDLYIRSLHTKSDHPVVAQAQPFGVALLAATMAYAGSPLLADRHFFFLHFGASKKRDAVDLITKGKGTTHFDEASLLSAIKTIEKSTCSTVSTTNASAATKKSNPAIIILTDGPTGSKGTVSKRLKESLKVHASSVIVVDCSWLFDSISCGALQAPQHYLPQSSMGKNLQTFILSAKCRYD